MPVSQSPSWAALKNKPTTISGYGITDAFANGQTVQIVSRNNGTTYYNTSGKPIEFKVRGYAGGNVGGYYYTAITVDGIEVENVRWYFATETGSQAVSAIVPAGSSYSFSTNLSATVYELRS